MLLGSHTYRNPPYRRPTPKGGTSNTDTPPATPPPAPPPLGSQSPKRKRGEEAAPAPASAPLPSSQLRIDTVVQQVHDEEIESSGANSPRTRVAERLQDLELQVSVSPRKRVKLEERRGGGGVVVGHGLRGGRYYQTPSRKGLELELEIAETPDGELNAAAAASSSFESKTEDEDEDEGASPPQVIVETIEATPPPPPPPPLPPSSQEDTAMTGNDGDEGTFINPLPNAQDSLFSRAELTWRDDEITGQKIDTTTPDDDGEGINGIGFKPTPAMAYARSQRRRQQVSDWKAREAKEARQRRLQRRRGESKDPVSSDPAVKRIVRFAGES